MLCRATVVREAAERARARSTHREDHFYARLHERIDTIATATCSRRAARSPPADHREHRRLRTSRKKLDCSGPPPGRHLRKSSDRLPVSTHGELSEQPSRQLMSTGSKLGKRLISPLAGFNRRQAPGITPDRFAFVNRRSRVQVSKVAPGRLAIQRH